MSAADRCDFSGLLKDQCGHCHPERLPQPSVRVLYAPREARYGPWFIAQFDSECAGSCGGVIDAGEHARSDGETGWLCELCGGYES